MVWKKELPTKPGWYWIESSKGGKSIIEIELSKRGVLLLGGGLLPREISKWQDYLIIKKWAGPIPEPREAK